MDYGVPAVAVQADAFARLVDSVARVNGMPHARRCFVPTPVIDRTPDQLRAYIEGDDPVRGGPFMARVLSLLEEPLPQEALRGVDLDRSAPRLVPPGTEDELRRLFEDNHWTDYLPIVLPTEERVEAMLAGTSRAPDEIVGQMRPTSYRELWSYDVEKVAVNAVMAGALPEHFPVILALASSGHTARQSSTSSAAGMVVVNGPIRHELNMNMGIGALGPYNRANAAIGRAFGLLSQNLQGGSVPGETYMGAQGNAMAYSSVTFAENEENSPWVPYHVQQGFDPEESTVTPFYVWGNTWNEGVRDTWPQKLKRMVTAQDPYLGVTLLMDPIAARRFVDVGFGTKDALIEWIYENCRVPRAEFWDNFGSRNLYHTIVELGEEPFTSYWNAGPEELIPVAEPDNIHVVVVGGSSNGQWSLFSARHVDRRFRNSPDDPATVSIEPWR